MIETGSIQGLQEMDKEAHNLKVVGSNPTPATKVFQHFIRFLPHFADRKIAQNPQCFSVSFKTNCRKIPRTDNSYIIRAIWEDRYDDREAFIDFRRDGFTPKQIKQAGLDVYQEYGDYLKLMKKLTTNKSNK